MGASEVILGIVSIAVSLGALVLALVNVRFVFSQFGPRTLRKLRCMAWAVLVCSMIILLLNPVAALTFDPRTGIRLYMAMVIGAVQTVVLAIQVAILHLIRVSQNEAS